MNASRACRRLLRVSLSVAILAPALGDIPFAHATTYEITNCTELQEMANDLAGDYFLGNDIDCDGVVGYVPVGNDVTPFTGTLDGRGQRILNLSINYSGPYTGIFGKIASSGSVGNVHLVGMTVSAGGNFLGSLAGYNDGEIYNISSDADIEGSSGMFVGGLIGLNYDNGLIADSYATGDVHAPGDTYVGGLVGQNRGNIVNTYASGTVTGSSGVGGLVGRHLVGAITDSFAAGYVSGGSNVGGLVGESSLSLYSSVFGTITNSYWSSYVSNVSVCYGDDPGSGDADCHDVTSPRSHFYDISNEPMAGSWDFSGEGFWRATGSALPGDSSDSLVGYWPFDYDDGGAVVDVSGNGNDITITYDGGDPAPAGVQNDSSLTFSAMASGAASQPVPLSDQFTLSTWVRLPSGMNPDSVGTPHIMAEYDTGANATDYALAYNGGSRTFVFYSDNFSGEDATLFFSTRIVDPQWHLLTVTYDGETLKGYIDGNLDASTLSSFLLGQSPGSLFNIGGRDGQDLFEWGSVDDMRVYARALSTSEVERMASYRITDCDGLQAMRNDLYGYYGLGKNVDCSESGTFEPVGTGDNPFHGYFDGFGRVISGLTVNSSDRAAGLFSAVGNDGVVRRVGITSGDIVGNHQNAGGLVGDNYGEIYDSFSWADVTTNDSNAGGLVGTNVGNIWATYAAGTVTATTGGAGGFAGQQAAGTIGDSYAKGAVNGGGVSGGFTGLQSGGDLTNVFATGLVADGLVNSGGLNGSYLSGGVSNSAWSSVTTGQESCGVIFGCTDVLADDLTANNVNPIQSWNLDYWVTPGNMLPLLAWEAPRSYYRFDGPNGDDTISQDDGYYSNNLTLLTNGEDGIIPQYSDTDLPPLDDTIFSNYLNIDFNGSTQYAYREVYNTVPQGELTLCGWLKTPGADEVLLQQGRNDPETEFVLRVDGAGKLNFWNHDTAMFGFPTDTSSDSVVNDGQWHHVCFVQDHDTGTYYVDGAQDGTTSTSFDAFVDPFDLTFAYDFKDGGSYFLGSMDDWRIYSRALSPPEIELLAMHAGEEPAATEISDCDALVGIGDGGLNGNYIQTKDIDCSETSFLQIGSDSTPFLGTYDGGGHVISNVRIDTSDNRIGVFGFVGSGAVVENVGVVDSLIVGNGIVGGLVGDNHGTVRNSFSSAQVYGNNTVGALLGQNYVGGYVENCYANGLVNANSFLGGFMGYNVGHVSNSYSASQVVSPSEGAGEDGHFVGGFAGYVDTGGIISNSFAGIPNFLSAGESHGQFAGEIADDSVLENVWYASGAEVADRCVGVGDTTPDCHPLAFDEFYDPEAAPFADWNFSGEEGPVWVAWGNTYPKLAWESPALYLPLDTQADGVTPDASGNGFGGTINGESTFGFDAPVTDEANTKSLTVDGEGDYLSISSSLNEALDDDVISVSAWVKADGESFASNSIIVTEAYTGDDNVEFTLGGNLFGDNPGKIGAGFFDGEWHSVVQASDFAFNRWTHVAATYDGTTLKLYVDGELEGSQDFSRPLPHGTEAWYVGKRWDIGNYFTGNIDDVRIYNALLGDARIRELSRNIPVGHWSLDDGAGNIVHDSDGPGNYLTVSATDLWTSDAAPTTFDNPYALDFNGEGYAESSIGVLPTGSDPRTLTGWFNMQTVPPPGSSSVMFAYGNCSVESDAFGAYIDPDSILHFWGCGGGDVNTNLTIEAGRWYQVSISYDGNILTMYLDGIPVISQVATLSTGSMSVDIGSDGSLYSGWEFYFNGSVDDVRVYDYALDWGQVQNLVAMADAEAEASFVTPPTPVDEESMFSGDSAVIQIDSGTDSPQETVLDWSSTLLGWWKLNTDGDLEDQSSYEHNLTNHGATYTENGRFGGAYFFDGNSYMDAGDIMPTGSGSYTKSAWININNLAAFNNIMSGSLGHAFWAGCSGHLAAGHNDEWCDLMDPEVLSQDVWYHVAVTYDGGTGMMRLYKNGLEVASGIEPGQSGTKLYVGAYDADNYFDGVIDEPQLYARPLSPSEISALYDSGGPRHLVGYWNMNEETEVPDSSGYQNSGETSSAPSVTDGVYGNARSFDGLGYQTIDVAPDDTELYSASNDTLTVSWWAMIPSDAPAIGVGGAGNDGAYFVSKTDGEDYEWGIKNDNNTQICFSYWLGGNIPQDCADYPFNGGNGADGEFHHYAMVFAATHATLYVDGSEVFNVNDTYDYGTSGAGLIIGGRTEKDTNHSFYGTLDDVRIYKGSFTAFDAQDLYETGANGSPYYNTFANLSSGTYQYLAYSQIGNGDVATTETRTLTVSSGSGGSCSAALVWHLDEGEGTIANDASGNGVDGEINNLSEPFWSTDAPTLDGSNPYSAEFTMSGQGISLSKETGSQYTVAFWMKSAGTNVEGGGSILGEFPYAGIFYADDAEGGGHLSYPTDGDGPSFNDTVISSDTWHHVAVVINGSSGRYYLDGALDGNFSNATNIDPNHFGGVPGVGYTFFGKLDELHIYDSILSADQIAELAGGSAECTSAGGGGGGMCSEILHHWTFDEGEGSSVVDSAGDIDGTLLGDEGQPAFSSDIPSALPGSDYSLLFSSADHQSVRFDPIELTDAYTMSMWVRIDDSQAGYSPLFTDESDVGFNVASDDKLDFYDGNDDLKSSGTLTHGVWHHVALVSDSGALTYYIDGAADAASHTAGIDSLTITRMGYAPHDANPLNGYIDDPRIYGFAMSDDQIASLAAGEEVDCSTCSPEAYWTFDEGEGAPDSTGNGHDGTLATGGEGYPQFSEDVPAVDFDDGLSLNFTDVTQSQRVEMSTPVSGDFTVSLWLKAPEEGVVSEDRYATLVDKDNDIGLYYTTSADETPNRLNFWHGADNFSSTPLGTAAWHHVALVNDGEGGATFYVDGEEDGSVSGTTASITFDRIGGDEGGNNFVGKIDDVRIYDFALNSTQVAQLSGGAAMCTDHVECGNGFVESGEECDDGNDANGDGCSSVCAVEESWSCEGDPSVCTTSCGPGFAPDAMSATRYGNYCYAVYNPDGGLTWDQAQTSCEGMGGTLATVRNQATQDFIYDSGMWVWLGATDVGDEGNYAWVGDASPFWTGGAAGSPVDGAFVNWFEGEPSNTGGQDCALMVADDSYRGQWDDADCDGSHYYACQFNEAGDAGMCTEASYWNFDEGEGSAASDQSASHNDLVLASDAEGGVLPTWSGDRPALGFSNANSLLFDGEANYARLDGLPDNIPVDDDPYTIAAWIKPNSMGSKGIVGWGEYMNTERVNAFRLTDSGLANYWWGDDLAVSTGDITGDWHHVAATYDGTWRKIYLDGELIGADHPVSGAHDVPSANNLTIGVTNGNEYFDGNIDDVRIYNVALSEQQIAEISGGAEQCTSPDFGSSATWTGAESAEWDDVANWSPHIVPDSTKDVVITDDGYHPSLSGTNPVIHDLMIESGATLYQAGQSLTVTGTFVNYGTLILTGDEGSVPEIATDKGTVMYVSSGEGGFNAGTDYYNLTLNDGLLGYWKFDENSDADVAADTSGYGRDGAYNPGSNATFGMGPAPALQFINPGSARFLPEEEGSVSLGDDDTFDFGSGATFSISAWVYPSSVSGFQRVINNGDYGFTNGWVLQSSTGDGTGGPAAGIGSGGNENDSVYFQALDPLPTGEWSHLAVVFDQDAKTAVMYVNGVPAPIAKAGDTCGVVDGDVLDYSACSHANADHSAATAIGSYNSEDEYFDGFMDEVRVYAHALSRNEIAALASGNEPATGEHTFSLEDDFNIRGDFTLNSGLIDMGGYDISLNGSWINNGGKVDAEGTLLLVGDGTETILSGGQPFERISTDGDGGTWMAQDPMVVSSRLLINENDVVGSQQHTMHIGYLERNGGALVNDGNMVTYDSLSSRSTDLSDRVQTTIIESPMESGMVGYWKFDEGNGDLAFDASGNGHYGTASGGIFHQSDRIGGVADLAFDNQTALRFNDSGQQVVISDDAALQPESYTVSTWVNFTSSGAVYAKTRSTACPSWGLEIDNDDKAVFSAITEESFWSLTSPSLEPDTWHNIAVTYDSDERTAVMYVDGESVDTQTSLDPVDYTSSSDLQLGQRIGTCEATAFRGSMDDLRIYDTALSSEQVAQLGAGYYATGMNGEGTTVYSLRDTDEAQTLDMVSGVLDQDGIPLRLTGNLNMYGGHLTGEVVTRRVDGDVFLGGGTLTSPNLFHVFGSWYHTPHGTFDPREGTVNFYGDDAMSITGNTTFHNLTFVTDGPVSFQGGSTTTVEGNLSMTHAEAGDHLVLRSMDSNPWYIDPQGEHNVSYTDVQLSTNTSGDDIRCTVHCIDSGDNVAWFFGSTCGNGLEEGDEQCDDGNTTAGDGCSASCQVEEGWTCASGYEGSICTAYGNACSPLVEYASTSLDGEAVANMSGDTFPGTIHGGVTLSDEAPAGVVGKSYVFDGTSGYIEADRPVAGSMTLCAWIKTTAVGHATTFSDTMPIVQADVGGYYTYDYGFGVNSEGTLTFGLGNFTGERDDNLIGETAVNTGEWTHVCAVRNRDTALVSIYVNGALDGSMGSVGYYQDMSPVIRIGYGNEENNPAFWEGNIADVRIYDTVLSPDDIAALAEDDLVCGGSSSSFSSSESSSVSEQRAGGGRGGGGGGGGGRTTGSTTAGSTSGTAGNAGEQSQREQVKASVDGKSQVFRDVWTDDWFGGFVKQVAERKIFNGYKDKLGKPLGLYGPADPITMGQLAKVAAIVGGKKVTETVGDQWAVPYMDEAKQAKLTAFLGSLDPNAQATRGAVIQSLLEALGIPLTEKSSLFSDVRVSSPYGAAIATAAKLGIVSGDTDAKGNPTWKFRPNAPVNRAEVAKMIILALQQR